MKSLIAMCALVVMVIAAVVPAAAEDSDQLRWYLHFKARDTDKSTGVHDYYGFGLGANINRYFGLELSGDRFEIFPEVGGRAIGEYGVFALMPQVRVRYPLFGDRLVPYVLGGAGIALTDFNDRKNPAFGVPISDESTTPVATLGGGIEYFFADNLAFSVEFKYLFAEEQTLRVGGVAQKVDVSNPLVSLGVRMFYPELRPTALADSLDTPPLRLFLGLRAGVAVLTDTQLASGLEARPVPPAMFGELNQYFGLALGLDINRYLGVEFGVDGSEVVMARKNVGSIGEYAIYTFIPQLRVRYPLMGGRVVPYALGGVGVGHAEFNDRKPRGENIKLEAVTNSVAAALGVGIEYFLMSNIALGLESKYLYTPGHTITIEGRDEDATAQTLAVSFGLRVYFASFGGR